MKAKILKYLIVAFGLAALVWANLANPIAFANTGNQSFNGQTVPTRTPIGSHPTNTPKPPKVPTDTPIPPSPAVGATFTPIAPAPTNAPVSTSTSTSTPVATTGAQTVTLAPLASETPSQTPTSVPVATGAATSTTNLPLVTTGGSTDTPTPSDNSGGNTATPIILIVGGIALLIVGFFLIFGRSKSSDQAKPQ
jgi:hypothetical protein